jgi:rSAM/selenodomain-associated transferase 1
MNTRNETVLIVFAKNPVPGRVKTRLIPELGEEGAAALYRELMERTLQTAAGSGLKHVELHCTPSIADPVFQDFRERFNLSLHLQQGRDLGERMHHAFSQVLFNNGAAVLIGCDCPGLKPEDLDTAREKLNDDVDVVLGPASDGGYYLIGLKEEQPSLFENMEWGGAYVLDKTRERIKERNLSCFELPTYTDIDRPGDIVEYQKIIG